MSITMPSTAQTVFTTPPTDGVPGKPAVQPGLSTFSTVLSQQQQARLKGVDFLAGRLGIEMDTRRQPANIVYFDEAGSRLCSSTFSAPQLLESAEKFGIDLAGLRELGQQLDAAGVGYRPYELYKGTGSDHGIDFEDLLAGGLGTAFDWRRDENVALKGSSAQVQLGSNQRLAQQLGLTARPQTTTEKGIDPARFEPLAAGTEAPRNHVMFNGKVAGWHHTAAAAQEQAQQYNGSSLVVRSAFVASSAGGAVAPNADAARIVAALSDLETILRPSVALGKADATLTLFSRKAE